MDRLQLPKDPRPDPPGEEQRPKAFHSKMHRMAPFKGSIRRLQIFPDSSAAEQGIIMTNNKLEEKNRAKGWASWRGQFPLARFEELYTTAAALRLDYKNNNDPNRREIIKKFYALHLSDMAAYCSEQHYPETWAIESDDPGVDPPVDDDVKKADLMFKDNYSVALGLGPPVEGNGAHSGGTQGAQFSGTQPSGAQPPGAQPPGAQFPGTQPSGAQPPGAQFPGTQPPGAQPPGAQFPGTQPSGAQPPGAQFPGTQPSGTQPPGAQPMVAQSNSDVMDIDDRMSALTIQGDPVLAKRQVAKTYQYLVFQRGGLHGPQHVWLPDSVVGVRNAETIDTVHRPDEAWIKSRKGKYQGIRWIALTMDGAITLGVGTWPPVCVCVVWIDNEPDTLLWRSDVLKVASQIRVDEDIKHFLFKTHVLIEGRDICIMSPTESGLIQGKIKATRYIANQQANVARTRLGLPAPVGLNQILPPPAMLQLPAPPQTQTSNAFGVPGQQSPPHLGTQALMQYGGQSPPQYGPQDPAQYSQGLSLFNQQSPTPTAPQIVPVLEQMMQRMMQQMLPTMVQMMHQVSHQPLSQSPVFQQSTPQPPADQQSPLAIQQQSPLAIQQPASQPMQQPTSQPAFNQQPASQPIQQPTSQPAFNQQQLPLTMQQPASQPVFNQQQLPLTMQQPASQPAFNQQQSLLPPANQHLALQSNEAASNQQLVSQQPTHQATAPPEFQNGHPNSNQQPSSQATSNQLAPQNNQSSVANYQQPSVYPA